jgi:Fic family protein
MRTPQKPPKWTAAFEQADPTKIQNLLMQLHSPAVEDFVRLVNDKYLHWDKLRFQTLPQGMDAKIAWAAVQLNRRGQRQLLPLSFTEREKLSFVLTPRHLEWLHNIDKQAGGAIGAENDFGLVDENRRYLYNSRMEEAIASSQLEGASTTRRVAKEMLRTNRKPQNNAERMILNNYRAMTEITDLKKEQLTPELLCHLQGVLTKDTLEDNPGAAGRFRVADDFVVVADNLTGDTLHDPPPAGEIDWRIREICEFANSISDPFIHPVIKAAVLHFAIGFVHPFVDGNGRTARAVFYWYMLKRNYWLFEYFPISRVLAKSPIKYARAYLYTETDGGDATYFIRFHLQAINAAIASFHEYVQNEHRAIKRAAKLLESFPGLNNRQRSFIHEAIKNSSINCSTRSHQGKYHVTYPTARADLLGLVKVGLVRPIKRGKTTFFYPADDLRQRLNVSMENPEIKDDDIPDSIAVTKTKPIKPSHDDLQQGTFFE